MNTQPLHSPQALWFAGRRQFRLLGSRASWAVWLSLLALVLTVAMMVVGGLAQRDVTRLQAALAALPAAPAARTPAGDAARLADFHALLPPAESIPPIIAGLMRSAASEGLVLQAGEYRAEPDVAGRYLQYRIALPVSGNAAALQRFLLAVLRDNRTLALESVTLKRERVEARQVEARIRLVLFTRLAAPGGVL